MILRATLIAIRIRDICNHWPQYSYMKNVPAHSNAIEFSYPSGAVSLLYPEQEDELEAVRDKQAYLQSLHTPT